MTVSDYVQKAYLLATGKTTTLAEGTAKYTKFLNLANLLQLKWQNEPGVDWPSLYLRENVSGTVSATDTFALPATIRKLSQRPEDKVRITRTDSTLDYYDIIQPDELKRYIGYNACAKIGSNLVFPSAFTASSAQFGGTIRVPGYGSVETLADDADTIAVEDPDWLCYMAAAEYVRNDITRQAQYGNLVALAVDSMNHMKLVAGVQPPQETKK